MARFDAALRFVVAMLAQSAILGALLIGAAIVICGSIAAARGLGWSEDIGGFIGVGAVIIFLSGPIGAAERGDGEAR